MKYQSVFCIRFLFLLIRDLRGKKLSEMFQASTSNRITASSTASGERNPS